VQLLIGVSSPFYYKHLNALHISAQLAPGTHTNTIQHMMAYQETRTRQDCLTQEQGEILPPKGTKKHHIRKQFYKFLFLSSERALLVQEFPRKKMLDYLLSD
jgi:hypothetical protein